MIKVNMQYFGGRSSSSGLMTTFEKFNSLSFPEDQEMISKSFEDAGIPKTLSDDFAGAIARDKKLNSGEDGTTVVDKLTGKQKDQVIDAYHKVLKEYGYTGDISVRTKKVAGTRSRLKGVGSKGATYETQVFYSYKKA